jgi:hypothetical protein
MGSWVVLNAWNESADGFHDCRFGDTPSQILAAMCYPVLKQHQVEPPEAPEFTISVKWQEGDLHEYLAGRNSYAHGWRYVLRWVQWDTQRAKVVTGYGYPSEHAARVAAEEKATKIAKAQQPEKVYKFKPEL